MDKFYIVMPAYNEAENIEDVILQWHPVAEKINADGDYCRLMIANDGSKDNTWEKLSALQDKYPYLIALNKPNSGHGATVLYLYRKALADGADYIFQTDSDGQTLPEEFWPMWESRKESDFHIGTRGGRQDGFSRIVVTKTLRFVVWLMFGVWVKDANTPFRLMNAEALKRVMAVIPEDFFLSNVAVSAIAVNWKESISWYPITFRSRQGGVNSINMKRIFKIGWKALGDFRMINKSLNSNRG